MTTKEKRYVRNLEIKVEQLEQALSRAQKIWKDQFSEIYESRTALYQAFGAIEEAVVIIHDCIKQDPRYMAENTERRIAVKADF